MVASLGARRLRGDRLEDPRQLRELGAELGQRVDLAVLDPRGDELEAGADEHLVIAFLGIFAFNYAFTPVLLATHPAITTIAK